MRYVLIIILTLAMLFAAGGCDTQPPDSGENSQEEQAGAEDSRVFRAVYLCADVSVQEFQYIAFGFREQAAALGMESVVIDCKGRADLFISALEELADLQPDALLVTASNEGLGPLISTKCEELDIPLLSIMCRLRNVQGQNIPYVGIDAFDCGVQGGELLVRQLAEAELLEGASASVILWNLSSRFYINQIAEGFQQSLRRALPQVKAEDYIVLEVPQENPDAMYQLLRSQLGEPVDGTRYLCPAYNDEGAYVFLGYVREREIDMSQVFVCSVGGGDYARSIFADATLAGSYQCVAANPFEIGGLAAASVEAALRRETPLPEVQTVSATLLDADNAAAYFDAVYGPVEEA